MTARERLYSAPLWIAAVVVPLAMALAFAQWSWRQVEREAIGLATHTADLLYEHLARSLEVHDTALEAVQVRIEGMSWPEIAADPTIPTLLKRLQQAAPHTNRLGIVDPSGLLLHISGVPFPGPRTAHAHRDFVVALRSAGPNTVAMGEPMAGRLTGDVVIPYGRPHLGPDGQPDGGVLWATFAQATLVAMFRAVRAEADDAIILFRDDGTILARYPPLPAAAAPRLPPTAPARAALTAIGAGAPSAIGRGLSPVDGIDRIFAVRRLDRVGISISYARATTSIRAAWFQRSLPMLMLTALAMALLLALTWRHRLSAQRTLAAERRIRAEAEHAAAAERARANAEAMLRHLQRVDTLGHVAAGLVHDFRNTIQAVQGGVAMIDRAIAQGNAARAHDLITQVKEASDRGVQLTQRLLAFTANRAELASTCALAPAIAATCRLLRTSLGPGYRLEENCAPNLPAAVRADPAELESALINLVINARDAMPDGGTITVVARPAATPPGAQSGAQSGAYVEISVTDTGIGMDAATLARATDAFFTTKKDTGTGIGLTSIAAFLDGIGGTMRLASTPGHGTTVTLTLPAAPDPPPLPHEAAMQGA